MTDSACAKILVVNDKATNRAQLVNTLMPTGYDITEAQTDNEALLLIEKHSFDLVLLDPLMSDLSGLELLRLIRKQYSPIQLPVIVVTTQYETENIIPALRQGANDYITKPIEVEVIRARIDAHLQRKQLQTELIKAKESAEQVNQEKSRFLSLMIHELRTPLNSILGFTELTVMEVQRNGHTQYLNHLESTQASGNNLLDLINSILDLSKIEAGKLDVRTEQFSVIELLEAISKLCRPLIDKNKNAIKISTNKVTTEIITDKAKVRQILLHLISNATKFTNEGLIQVESDLHRNATQYTLTLQVRDSGIGIPKTQQRKIFTEFYQGNNTPTTNGTGLGLTIAKRLCTLLGGNIELQSAPKAGCIFTVTLPVGVASRVEPLETAH